MVLQITVQAIVKAPLVQVWSAYVSADDIVQWNAASDDWHTTRAEVDLRVGGAFVYRMEAKDGSSGFDFAGTYRVVEPERVLAYDFFGRSARVEFADGHDGVTVSVTFEAETENPIEMQQEGWQAILTRFKHHVEADSQE
ncbi:MAG: hypothetical protein RJA87_1786 [Pseudomonadota bacterium]|jgi:uncharacterized protein YndB with AHSA1/START domain